MGVSVNRGPQDRPQDNVGICKDPERQPTFLRNLLTDPLRPTPGISLAIAVREPHWGLHVYLGLVAGFLRISIYHINVETYTITKLLHLYLLSMIR